MDSQAMGQIGTNSRHNVELSPVIYELPHHLQCLTLQMCLMRILQPGSQSEWTEWQLASLFQEDIADDLLETQIELQIHLVIARSTRVPVVQLHMRIPVPVRYIGKLGEARSSGKRETLAYYWSGGASGSPQ